MPASARFILLALLLAWLGQCAIYAPTLRQLPFGDDWGPPLTEIVRGERLGPLSFFSETRQPDSYRPVQSLLMWAFGRVDEPYRWESIRALHFLSSGVAFVVLGLLLHQWAFGRAGVIAAGVVAAVHPSLVAPVGSIDGFSSVLSCAAVWWGVWLMGRAGDRLWLAIVYAAVALVAGTLVKEYAFAMTPMAVLFAWFSFKPRWRAALLTAVVLGGLTVALLWSRQYVKPADMGPATADFAVASPALLAGNAALVMVGGFFFGDSLWLYMARDRVAIGVAVAVTLATLLVLVGGLWRRLRASDDTDANADAGDDVASARLLAAFLVLSIGAITFPANSVMRISEMYLCGLVFTVAFLAALAADGWALDPSRGRRTVAWAAGGLVAIAATVAVRHKMSAMLALGERTRVMTDAIRAEVAATPAARSVALLHRRDQMRARGTFSSFALPDCFLIRPPAADYLFPGRGRELICPSTVANTPLPLLADERAVMAFDRSIADVVLYWDVKESRFVRLK